MKHIVKWGIIGLGNIAFEFAKSFYNSDNADLIAVASRTNEKLIKFKQKFNINDENHYNYYEKILENDSIDIVYIALPNAFHFEWILKAIEKNKNVFVEKPYLPKGPNKNYLRWLYTAITRAKKNLYLIGFPNEDFKSIH